MKRKAILFVLLLMLMTILAISVNAQTIDSGVCGDNLTWVLDSDGTITISGTGEMWDYEYYYANPPWSDKSESIERVVIEHGVTSVGNDAFHFFGNLTCVTIADSVTSIGDGAFHQCRALSDVMIPDSVMRIGNGAFYGCYALNCTVYNNAKYIGNPSNPYLMLVEVQTREISTCQVHPSTKFIESYAFGNCASLRDVTISANVISIGEHAFEGCKNLSGIWVHENNPNYSSDSTGVLYNKNKTQLLHCPSGIFGKYVIPDSVTNIKDDAFAACSNLDYTVYNNANYIGTSADPYWMLVSAQSADITSCTIYSGTRIIGASAFYNCKSLNEITIPKSVESIGESAFYGCSNLERVNIADLAAWCGISFGDSPLMYADEFFVNGKRITDLVIPDGVTKISDYAFHEHRFNSITIPDSATHIGDYAFTSCTQKLILGRGIKSIGKLAFYNDLYMEPIDVYITDIAAWCGISFDEQGNPSSWGKLYLNGKLVTDLVIPEGVTVIKSSAFYGCESLTAVTIPASVTTISPSAFSYCDNLARYVVDKNNPSYSSDSSGVLFNKDKSTLIKCPSKFVGTYIVPDSVMNINGSAFYACSGLMGVVIGDAVTDIGSAAFFDCDKLTVVSVPNGVTKIGDNAFGYCDSLTSVVIGEGVKVIGEAAFSFCYKLDCVVIGSGVTYIDDYAFAIVNHNVKHMFFSGSEDAWRRIAFGQNNYALMGAMFHYNMEGYTAVDCAGVYCSLCEKTVVAGAKTHKYVTKTIAPTCTKKGYTAYICAVCGDRYADNEVAATGHEYEQGICKICGWECADYNGLVEVNGVWGYYEGGVLQEDYTGLVPYGDILFYVENGILDFTYTGLVWYNDVWTYVANSQLTQGYTGLVWFNDNWFYTVDSVIDWTFTGLVPYEGNYFYVQNNLLDWSYTGLGYHDGEWYFIQNALLQLDYVGLVYFNDTWFYVEDGHLTWDYTGMVEYEGNWFYVQNNVLDWGYTGLGYHDGGWYFIQNALMQKNYDGLVFFNATWFYIENGELTWNTNGLHPHEGKLYYIVGSVVDWGFYGIAEYNGVSYEVKAGVVSDAVLPVTVTFTNMDHSLYGASNRKVELIYSLATVYGGDPEVAAAINSFLQGEYTAYLNSLSGMEDFLSFMDKDTTFVNNEAGAVSYNDGEILSLRYETNWWMGGVSNWIPYGYTFDLKTGNLLGLADLFPDEDDLLEYLQDVICKYLKDVGFYDSYTEEIIKDHKLTDFEYYVSESGELILCIPVNTLGTAAGSMEIACGIYVNA